MLDDPKSRPWHFLNSAQTATFTEDLPEGFAFFAGQWVWFGIRYLDLPEVERDQLIFALASQGVRVPGSSLRFRTVGVMGWLFALVEQARGDEPALPANWLAGLELGFEPRWIGQFRIDQSERLPSCPANLESVDRSLYEIHSHGWKLRGTPALPEFMQAFQQ